jgi:hypothetical protein
MDFAFLSNKVWQHKQRFDETFKRIERDEIYHPSGIWHFGGNGILKYCGLAACYQWHRSLQ